MKTGMPGARALSEIALGENVTHLGSARLGLRPQLINHRRVTSAASIFAVLVVLVASGCAADAGPGPKQPVQLGEPSKDVDPDVIGAAVRDNSRHFQLCYETARERNPGLAGQLQVRFVINADGSVGPAMVVESSLPPDVSECVVSAFSTLRLPKQQAAVVAQYPMFFEPS